MKWQQLKTNKKVLNWNENTYTYKMKLTHCVTLNFGTHALFLCSWIKYAHVHKRARSHNSKVKWSFFIFSSKLIDGREYCTVRLKSTQLHIYQQFFNFFVYWCRKWCCSMIPFFLIIVFSTLSICFRCHHDQCHSCNFCICICNVYVYVIWHTNRCHSRANYLHRSMNIAIVVVQLGEENV